MLRFRGADLRPVLVEAKANNCRVILVKDQGVYFMSDKGERDEKGRHKLLAFAVGCNPDVDGFDDWWELGRQELGGDDFGEYFDINDPLFAALLANGDDLVVQATETELTLEAVKPEAAIPDSGMAPD
jgi:hypothetical protein